MKLSKRRLWLFGAIAIGAIVLITLLAAPANQRLNSGSTYGRAPDGYGAWYAFMEKRGTPIQRWQKVFEDLAKDDAAKPPITLLRIYGQLRPSSLDNEEREWVEKGNTLVILGVRQPVTEARFSTMQASPVGNVKIDTARRATDFEKKRLGDRFGAVVWEETLDKGRVIFATTPYLAANAYQDIQSNYEFLAQLVTQPGVEGEGLTQISDVQPVTQINSSSPVWVDEYIHGYKDKQAIEGEQRQNVLSYLAKTPLFPAFVQALILLLVAIWAANRRFGKPVTLSAPIVHNSEAYIQALASVLRKAQSSEFVLEVVGKEEQLHLQKALVLGEVPLDHQSLVAAWVQQTGRPATELEQLLQLQSRKRRISETDLLTWLGKWEQIRRHLPPSRTDK